MAWAEHTATAMKVLGYVRVSTDEQAMSGVSLEAQQAKLEAYASLYDLELIEVIADAGVSAKSFDRPGLAAGVGYAAQGQSTRLVSRQA
jgi:site-specific DNA recombinase